MRQLSNQHDIYSKHSWASLPLATVIVIYSPSTAADRVQVTLQSSGAISSVDFDVYEKQAPVASFYSPDKTINVKLYMIGFVDETSSSTNDFLLPEPAPLTHCANLTIHNAQRWNDTLILSGGVLEDSKCSYHFVYYEFTRNGHPVLKGGTLEPVISIRFNNNATLTPLKQLSMYTSHKTLGVYKNPDGNSTTAFRVLKEMNATHTKTASCSPPTHTDACTMQFIFQVSCIPSPQEAFNAANANIFRNKSNKPYFPNVVTIATPQMQ